MNAADLLGYYAFLVKYRSKILCFLVRIYVLQAILLKTQAFTYLDRRFMCQLQ
jgi:hypothetical protein